MSAISRLVNVAWTWFKWTVLLAIVGGVAAVPYVHSQLNDEIRRHVERLLANHYGNLGVIIRSARLVSGEGIELRGLSIFEPGASGPQAELLYVDEIFFHCSTELTELLSGDIDLRQAVFRRPTLRTTKRTDGTWSAAQLWPMPKFGDRPPITVIENGTLEAIDPFKPSGSTLRLREANLRMTPLETPENVGPFAKKPPLRVQGTAMADYVRQITVDAMIGPNNTAGQNAWSAVGTLDGVELSPELLRTLPIESSSSSVAALETVRAQAQGRFRVQYDSLAANRWDYEVVGSLQRGRVDDPRLPYPLTELRATFRCDPRGCSLSDLNTRMGQCALRLDAARQGHAPDSPWQIRAEARRLQLDARLLSVLPVKYQDEWHKYLPSGEVDLEAQLAFDGKTMRSSAVCKCLNVAFTFHRFPYRLERTTGTIELKNGLIDMKLLAQGDASEVRLVGQFQTNAQPVYGWLEVRSDNMRFDDRLVQALPGKAVDVVRSLHPQGTFRLFYKHWRSPNETTDHRYLHATVAHCNIRFDKFPYPLDEIHGVLEMHDNFWTIRDLEGTNGAGQVTCNGTLQPGDGGYELALNFVGKQVLLEEELRNALSPAARQLWQDLKPQGAVNLATTVRVVPGDPQMKLAVRIEPIGDSVSIEPQYFPYRLDRLHGVFTYADDQVTLEQVRAEHGRTRITGAGRCQLFREGGWRLQLEKMSIDRLAADRDLITAVPERLKKVLADLHLTGAVNLRGGFDLASRGVPGEPFTSGWDVHIDLHQNNADLGLLFENAHGELHLAGTFDGSKLRCTGDARLDSLTYKNWQLTEITGPIWIDDTRVLLGFWADRQREMKPERHMTAKLYSGLMALDGWLLFGPQAPYEFQATLSKGDLRQLTQEAMVGRQRLSGDIYAEVVLRGRGKSLNDLGGRGAVQLRNANIYELPFMVSLLKILSVRQPDLTAFTDSDVNFRVEGEHLYVDRIDFKGDAISLLGKGEMNLNKQIHLTFHSVVGRDRIRVPIVSEVMGGASQQIMLIHAEGTIDEPQLRRETFPGVNQALQQLQAELQR
jgi:hypothetical protein